MKPLFATIVVLLSSCSLYAGCTLKGEVKLTPPYNAVLCRVNGVPEWIVGYSEPYNAFAITKVSDKQMWLLPATELTHYAGTLSTRGSATAFTFKSGAYEDEHRVRVELTGN